MGDNIQMEELSINELANRYNFIIPEIQREYVWGKNDNDIIGSFFDDIKESYAGANDLNNACFKNLKESLNPILLADFTVNTLEQLEIALDRFENNRAMNIGFLYSYKPNYYVYNDICEDVYLIDGQQRFTSLFLALFFFAIKESKRDAFLKLFRINPEKGKIGFDYRVRTLTHNFLIDLIVNTQENSDDLVSLRGKIWFLAEYETDVSIQAMLGAFSKLHEKFNESQTKYFEFICNQIKFWHFKTEETSQGEELYITMNSRGKSLSENEILRAELFENEDSGTIKEWGQKWEKWQDFFWEKKGGNECADSGFNEFLRWVQILTMVNRNNIDTSNESEDSNDKKAIIEIIKWERKDLKLNSNYLTLKEIELYFKAIEYIFKTFIPKSIATNYPDYFNTDLLNDKWFCPENNKTIEQIDCFRLLPLLEYCKLTLQKGQKIDDQELYRVIRYFYNLHKLETVSKAANVACINGIKLITELIKNNNSYDIADIYQLSNISKTLLTEEEKYKFELFKESKNRETLEQEFWEAEDYKLNSGRIGHLLQITFVSLETIHNFKYDNSFNAIRGKPFVLTKFKEVKMKFFNLVGENKKITSQIWGHFLITDYYKTSGYGSNQWTITCIYQDYYALISKEFLKMVLEIGENQTSQNYLKSLTKTFLETYSNLDSIRQEKDFKKQLFIYFILLNASWSWDKGKNFGAYDKNAEGGFTESIFSHKILFQHYDQKWGGAKWRNVDLSQFGMNTYLDSLRRLCNFAN